MLWRQCPAETAEAAAVAEEVVEAEGIAILPILRVRLRAKVKIVIRKSGQHPNILTVPQIMPVLTIIPMAVKLFSVVIHLSVAGPRSLLIQDQSQSASDSLGSLIPNVTGKIFMTLYTIHCTLV